MCKQDEVCEVSEMLIPFFFFKKKMMVAEGHIIALVISKEYMERPADLTEKWAN